MGKILKSLRMENYIMRMAGKYPGDAGPIGDPAASAGGGLFSFLSKYPSWVTTLLIIIGVIILAWVVGIIVGKLYSSIKYPDPNKVAIFSPKQKIIFLGVTTAVIAMLYITLNNPIKPKDDTILPSDQISGDILNDEAKPDLDIDIDKDKNQDDAKDDINLAIDLPTKKPL